MACDVCMGINSHNCPVCGKNDWITCPTCKGYGIVNCTAYDIHRDKVISVTAATYYALPDNEVQALADDKNFCKDDAEVCPECGGDCKVLKK